MSKTYIEIRGVKIISKKLVGKLLMVGFVIGLVIGSIYYMNL